MTINELLFENLDDNHYTSAQAAAVEYSVFENDFHEVLGYDPKTGGSVALQKGHQPKALLDELPTAAILKTNGHTVILTDETGKGKQLDCTIDGVLSEIKLVKTFSFRALKEDFYEAHKKGAKRVVLTISTETDRQSLETVLKRIAHNPMVNQVDDLFLIFNNQLEKVKLSSFK